MYKIKYKNILLTILLICLIFLSGCGGECKESSDCPSKTCYLVKCVDKKCVETSKENCCGNGICEAKAGETECSCEEDCGECAENVGTYLEYLCDGDECVTDVRKGVIQKASFTDKISIRGVGDISATYTFDQPFNVDGSLFNIRLVLENKQSSIEYVKINKVNVYEELGIRGVQVKSYGEKIVDRILWDPRIEVVDDVVLEFPSNMTEDEKILTVEIIYEYAKLYRGSIIIGSGSYKKQLQEEMYFVDPSKKRRCPESCDDNNPCTLDGCSVTTNYFCKHVIKEGSCCGNHKCDSDENKCSCQQDCGYCEREFSDYIEFVCISDECSSRLRTEAVPKTLIENINMKDIVIEMKTTFNEPFNIEIDNYKVDLELQSMADDVNNTKCTKFQVLSRDELLAEKDISSSFRSIGASSSTEFGTSFSVKEVEEIKSTIIKLTCSYNKTVRNATTNYIRTGIQSLGTLTYVDPDV